MMRLLRTLGGCLDAPTARPPRYAVLSHTWGDDEMSFQAMNADGSTAYISAVVEGIDEPRAGWKKVLCACDVAHRQGLHYLWADTCCIDKTNLTELSAAINSMFRWYAEAEVCLVYLADVPDDDDVRHRHSRFRSSRWFERGWTLQELLAPKEVRFYSQGWQFLGTRTTLSDLIQDITRIPSDVLVGGECRAPARSIGEIFSWASRRTTTLEEDRAYSLLGLLDINMTLIYGEGSKALLRVQKELLREYDDDSIFAWEADPDQATRRPLFGLLSPTLDYFEASHRFVRPRIRTRLDGNPVMITSLGISVHFYLVADESLLGQGQALLNCRIVGTDESEAQPAIFVRHLGGKQFARVEAHHIRSVRFSTLPEADKIPFISPMVFSQDPIPPLPITSFVVQPEHVLARGLYTPHDRYAGPYSIVATVSTPLPASSWRRLWDKGLVIDFPTTAVAPRVRVTDRGSTLSLVGSLLIEVHERTLAADHIIGTAKILCVTEATVSTGPGGATQKKPWCCILKESARDDVAAFQSLPAAPRSWPTSLFLLLYPKLQSPTAVGAGAKSHIEVVVDLAERQGPGRVMYGISLATSRLVGRETEREREARGPRVAENNAGALPERGAAATIVGALFGLPGNRRD